MSGLREIDSSAFASTLVHPDDLPGRYGPTLVYAFYDADDAVLYVGVTGRPAERWTQHRRKAPWWGSARKLKTLMTPSMYDALKLEREVIRAVRPVWNRRSAVRGSD